MPCAGGASPARGLPPAPGRPNTRGVPLADRENGSNSQEGQCERERELHRAQLEAVRSAYTAQGEGATPGGEGPEGAARNDYLLARLRTDIRRLDRRQRSTAWIA